MKISNATLFPESHKCSWYVKVELHSWYGLYGYIAIILSVNWGLLSIRPLMGFRSCSPVQGSPGSFCCSQARGWVGWSSPSSPWPTHHWPVATDTERLGWVHAVPSGSSARPSAHGGRREGVSASCAGQTLQPWGGLKSLVHNLQLTHTVPHQLHFPLVIPRLSLIYTQT